jgi:hypothetical protein
MEEPDVPRESRRIAAGLRELLTDKVAAVGNDPEYARAAEMQTDAYMEAELRPNLQARLLLAGAMDGVLPADLLALHPDRNIVVAALVLAERDVLLRAYMAQVARCDGLEARVTALENDLVAMRAEAGELDLGALGVTDA